MNKFIRVGEKDSNILQGAPKVLNSSCAAQGFQAMTIFCLVLPGSS